MNSPAIRNATDRGPAQQPGCAVHNPVRNPAFPHSNVPNRLAKSHELADLVSELCNKRVGLDRKIYARVRMISPLSRKPHTSALLFRWKGNETHCEQNANLIGIQLFIFLKIPCVTGHPMAF